MSNQHYNLESVYPNWTMPYAELFKYWQEQGYQLFKI